MFANHRAHLKRTEHLRHVRVDCDAEGVDDVVSWAEVSPVNVVEELETVGLSLEPAD